MDINETRKALLKWFTNRFFEETKKSDKEEDEILENYVIGYIECGGLLDNDSIKLSLLRFKEVKKIFGIDIESYGIRNYLTGYGDDLTNCLSLREAIKFNETLNVNDVRLMIARRFGLSITSNMYTLLEKLPYLTGYIDCGCTLEDLVNTGNEKDKEIADGILKFINTLPSEYRANYVRYLSNNAVKRSLIDRLEKGKNNTK